LKQGLLVMAYGTPRSLDEVEAYYTDIRHGKTPPPELIEDLKERYRAIGGRSPLLEITQAQARGLADRLGVPSYVGQKHAAPTIPDAVEAAQRDGVERLVGIVLAPHYSKMSIGDYVRRAERAAEELGWKGDLEMILQWHTVPGFLDWLSSRVKETLAQLPAALQDDALVVFSAHSLPERITRNDPYAQQLAETGRAVAERTGLADFRIGWQSAGRTADPWLGPDILEILDEESARGRRALVVCPCGFASDHLEVLYDIDIEAQNRARESAIELRRTRSPNDDPAFLDVLAGVVARRLE
jgi:ferrochelatase